MCVREEWDWIQKLSITCDKETSETREEAAPLTESHAPLLYHELQSAIKTLLKHLHLHLEQVSLSLSLSLRLSHTHTPTHTPMPVCLPLYLGMLVHVLVSCACLCLQASDFRLYSQEVVELAHGVSLLLLLPAADSVCSAPGQSNLYTPLSGFLHLPLQMFEMGIAHVQTTTVMSDHIGVLHLFFSSFSSFLHLQREVHQSVLSAVFRPRPGCPNYPAGTAGSHH